MRKKICSRNSISTQSVVIGFVIFFLAFTWVATTEFRMTNVVLASSDTTNPTVSITSPSNGVSVPIGITNVTGTALDSGSGIKKIQVITNGTSLITATPKSPGDWSKWYATIQFSVVGSNIVYVKATDNAGNIQWINNKVKVAYDTPSILSITAPSNGVTILGGITNVTGTALDSGNGIKKIQVITNGTSLITATPKSPGDWSKWYATIQFSVVGSNIVYVKATDNAGFIQWIHNKVTVVDTKQPTVTITSPINGVTVLAQNVTISGTGSDIGTGIQIVQASTNGSGFITATPKSVGDWSTWYVSLPFSSPGNNIIHVKAVDFANNIRWANLQVTVADRTTKPIASKPIPFLFIVRTWFPDMKDLTSLYKLHANSTDMIDQFTNQTLPKSVTDVVPGMRAVTFMNLADIKNNANMLHNNNYTWIIYDLEPAYSPPNEVADPVNSVKQAAQVAHNNGMKLMITPALIPRAYVQAMAYYSDGYLVQAQYMINGTPQEFTNHFTSLVNVIRTTSPNKPIIMQGSMIIDTPDQVIGAYDIAKKMINGITVFYNQTSDLPGIAKVLTHVDGKS